MYMRVSDVLGRWKHIAELLVPDPSPFEVELMTTNLKKWR
jgi:hypothetical protein